MVRKSIVLLLVVLVGLASCGKKPLPVVEPQITITEEEVVVGCDFAVLKGQCDYDEKINFIEVEVVNPEHVSFGAGGELFKATMNGNRYSVRLKHLLAGVTYDYRYIIGYGDTSVYYCDKQCLTTSIYVPFVTTNDLLANEETRARVRGTVGFDGGAHVFERGFCWNTEGDPTVNDSVVRYYHWGTGEYDCWIYNLVFGETYHVRAYAKNSCGVGYGNTLTFVAGFPD